MRSPEREIRSVRQVIGGNRVVPYKRVGKDIYHKVNGWKKKQTCASVGQAKKALRLLRGLHAGTIKRRKQL